MAVRIGVLREPAPERRVALVPEVVARLTGDGLEVLVEPGAGEDAGYADGTFVTAGARLVPAAEVVAGTDILLAVRRPAPEVLDELTEGQVLLGLLDARGDRAGLVALAARGVRPLSLDLLPRTLSRAQAMDALSSQAAVAGYRAAVVAAEAYGRYLPMMVTAAGTARPAKVLVLGAGVAGLQAVGTARRLGAQVTGYDVRPAAREEIASLGAAFLRTSLDAAAEGGYARTLTPEETAAQQAEVAAAAARFDIVITAAQVPGGTPPVLLPASALEAMAPGSVVLDAASGPRGGNVEGAVPGKVLDVGGVVVIGADDLPSQMAPAASDAYAHNLGAVIAAVVVDGELVLDDGDDVVGAVWVQEVDS